jgi:hypothetical protein
VYEDGVLYDRTKTTLVYYSMSNPRTDFTIPDTVRTIGRNAFFGCSNLTAVTVPDGVECMSKGAFAYCTGLKKLEVAASVSLIEEWAFCNCTKLTTLDVSKHASIADHAFSRCPAQVTRSQVTS